VLRNILILNTTRTGATDLATQMRQIELANVLKYGSCD